MNSERQTVVCPCCHQSFEIVVSIQSSVDCARREAAAEAAFPIAEVLH